MSPVIHKIVMLLISTLAIWAGVGMIYVTGLEDLQVAAVILAFLGSMALWLVFGLDEIGKQPPKANPAAREKAKRDSVHDDDPRLALMLSLMTPDERDALKARLADELQADGEALPLADLLAKNGTDHDHITDRT